MNEHGETPRAVDAAEPTAAARGTHQFSLRDLLWFVALLSLWCSQATILRSAEMTGHGLEFPLTAANLTSIFLAWPVLLFFCFRQRFYGIFFCHLLAPPTGTIFILFRDGGTSGLWQGFVSIVFMMNHVCFPGTVIAMTWRWLDTPVEHARATKDREK